MGFGNIVGDLTGGILGESSTEKAAKDANKISKAAQQKTLAEYASEWTDVSQWLTPYLEQGTQALAAYKTAIGAPPDQPVFTPFNFDVSKIESNPAYQFVREQGLTALDRMAATNRQLGSGNRMMAAEKYASGLASTEYQNEFNRQLQAYTTNRDTQQLGYTNKYDLWGNQVNDWAHLAGLGVNTAGNLSSFRQSLAENRANTYANRAAERTSASLIPAQEKGSFVNNLISTGGMLLGASMLGGKTPAAPQ